MGKSKIVNRNREIKSFDDYRIALEKRVLEMTESMLSDVQKSLEEELEGLALFTMQMMMEAEREEIVGKWYKHNSDRQYVRGGTNPGSVYLNGKKHPVKIPRVVEKETKKSYTLKTATVFTKMTELAKRAYTDLIRGVSTRRYGDGVGKFLGGYGISPASVSRHMQKATAEKLEELMEKRLEDLDLTVVQIDGVSVGGNTVVVALGVDTEGEKHILGMWQGSTEKKTVVRGLINDLIDRGLDTERNLLFVIDGSKALYGAITEVFGTDTPIQRCTVHKKRNVLDLLNESDEHRIKQRMSEAYGMLSFEDAKSHLLEIAEELDRLNPSAARSLREGLEETLTLHRLGIDGTLRRSLQTTNLIESAISVVRHHTRNVKYWQSGEQRERWIAAGLLEAEKKFNRVKGYGQMKTLVDALKYLTESKTTAA